MDLTSVLTETSGRLRSRLLSTTADGSRRCAPLLSTLRAVHQEDMFLFCGFSFLLGLSVCTVRIYTAKWQLWACERDFRALKYHLWSSTSSGQSLCFFSDFFLCVENKSDSELAHRQTPVLRAVHDHWKSSLALVVCCDSTVSSADLDGTAAPENRRTGALYLAAISCLVRGRLTLDFSTFFLFPPPS